MLSYDLKVMVKKGLTNMQRRISGFGLVLMLAGLATSARADLFQISGATPNCAGTGCPGTAPSLTVNQTQAPDNFSFNFAVNGSGDTYTASGTEYATYTSGGGTTFKVNLNVVYTGLSSTTVVDTFGIDVFQNFFDSAPGSWDGTYTEDSGITISPGVGNGTSISLNAIYNGGSNTGAVGELGPYTTNQNDASASNTLVGLGTGNTLAAYFQFNYSFAAGTQSESGVSLTSPTPEPRETLPLVGLLLAGRRGMGVAAEKVRYGTFDKEGRDMNSDDSIRDSQENAAQNPERREALAKFGRFAAYAAPFTVLALAQKADAATSTGPGKHSVKH